MVACDAFRYQPLADFTQEGALFPPAPLGVSEQALQHLTEPFFRGDEARTFATGSGLGLAIVERAIQRMGGTLSVFNHSAGGLMAVIQLKEGH